MYDSPTHRTRNARKGGVLILAMLAISACAPLSVMQDARLVPQGDERVGVGGVLTLPLEKKTVYDPNYGTGPVPTINDKTDLYLKPLPSIVGWYRKGYGWVEVQSSFALPSLIITLATKLGLIGRKPGSPFALSLSAELNWGPIDGSTTIGGTLLMSVMLSSRVSLDLTGRVGNYPGFGLGMTVTPTLGVSYELTDRKRLHILVGGVVPTGYGEAKPTAWIAAGYSY